MVVRDRASRAGDSATLPPGRASGSLASGRERGQTSGHPARKRPKRPRRPGRSAVDSVTTYTADLVSQRSGLGCLFEIVETLVLTLVIFFVIQNFVAQPYRVQQQSMEDTLQPGEYVLVDKLTPRFNDYQRGEVVVFTPPETFPQPDGTPFIKRVIGLPGDEVSIRDGAVYINDARLEEPYVKGGVTEPPPGQDRWVIPADEYFVMGDNRSNSADSRVFGPVPRDVIIGRAWLRYWPLDTFGVLETPTYPGVDEAALLPGALDVAAIVAWGFRPGLP